MFQTNAEFLSLLGQFVVTGVIIAVFCDAVRFLRIALGAGKIVVFITDFILTVISALVVMFVSIEIGSGKLRLYYFLAAVMGMAIYFLTIGMLTRIIAVGFRKIFAHLKKYVGRLLYNPLVTFVGAIKQKVLTGFGRLQQKISKYAENLHFGLKKHTPMMYNNKIEKLCTNGGEERNVIKAKIRKKV